MNPFDVFELDEVDAGEAVHRIELLCLELLRTGSVMFSSPNPQQRFCIDGAIRTGKTSRVLKAHSEFLVRTLIVAKFSHATLLANKTCTTREVYYRNKQKQQEGDDADWEKDRFANEHQANRTMALLCQILGVTRMSLGFVACSKGLCAGLMPHNRNQILPVPSLWQNVNNNDLQVTEICNAILQLQPRFVLVLEKHTVLFKLVQSEFMSRFPCIAVTGKGFPDLETRRFIRFLVDNYHLPVLGVCDLNPHGLSILSTFAHGSWNFSGEGFRYAVPTLQILGLTQQDGEDYAAFCLENHIHAEFAEFTAQDDACLKGMLEHNAQVVNSEQLYVEFHAMQHSRRKLDLDSLECIQDGFLFDYWLPNKLAQL